MASSALYVSIERKWLYVHDLVWCSLASYLNGYAAAAAVTFGL